MIRLGFVAVLVVATSAGCGHRMFVPPAGPGSPVTDVGPAWTAATSLCRSATTYVAALRVSGRAGSSRIWPVSVEAALAGDDSIYLSATFSGRPIFVLAGRAGRATLWLREDPQNPRAVVATPGEIVEAILGMSLSPSRLLAVLSGCVTRAFSATSAVSHGSLIAVLTEDARVFLERQGGVWQTRAGDADGLVVEFQRESSRLPQKVWIQTAPGRDPRATLDVTVNSAELNGAVPASFFDVPPGAAAAEPMTIDELRAAGPLARRGR